MEGGDDRSLDHLRDELEGHLQAGRYDEALSAAQTVCDLVRAASDAGSPDYADALDVLGEVHEAREEYADAETSYRKAMEIVANTQGKSSKAYAGAVRAVADVLTRARCFEEAKKLYLEVLAIDRRVLGD